MTYPMRLGICRDRGYHHIPIEIFQMGYATCHSCGKDFPLELAHKMLVNLEFMYESGRTSIGAVDFIFPEEALPIALE